MKYICDFTNCGKIYSHQSGMYRHRLIHTSTRQFKCVECEYVTSRADVLGVHILTHYIKYPCEAAGCKKLFANRSSLLQHTRTFHNTTKRIYSCSQCSYKSNQKNNLKRHLEAKHEIGMEQIFTNDIL